MNRALDGRGFAGTSVQVTSYKDFIQKHPEAKQAQEAKRALERREADRDWKSAVEANSRQAYEGFIKRHSTSRYVAEAMKRRAAAPSTKHRLRERTKRSWNSSSNTPAPTVWMKRYRNGEDRSASRPESSYHGPPYRTFMQGKRAAGGRPIPAGSTCTPSVHLHANNTRADA